MPLDLAAETSYAAVTPIIGASLSRVEGPMKLRVSSREWRTDKSNGRIPRARYSCCILAFGLGDVELFGPIRDIKPLRWSAICKHD
jgi:hypothetical protein